MHATTLKRRVRKIMQGLLLATAAAAVPAQSVPMPQVGSGRIERMESLASKHVAPRHVDVWLPEGYNAARRYNVLYMHDGQNLFDLAVMRSGATLSQHVWGVDVAVARLVKAGRIPDTIIVGVWNSSDTRYAEYYPQKVLAYTDEATRREYVEDASRGRSLADAYLRFLVEELKPAVDARYATRPGPDGTFVMGSSMGGLISLYALCEYPQVFGGAAALSTHWIGKPTAWGRERVRNAALPLAAMTYLARMLPSAADHRVYTDRGDDWLDALYEPAHRMVEEVLRDRGYTEASAMTRIFHGTGHNEADWALRLDVPLVFLMGRLRANW